MTYKLAAVSQIQRSLGLIYFSNKRCLKNDKSQSVYTSDFICFEGYRGMNGALNVTA